MRAAIAAGGVGTDDFPASAQPVVAAMAASGEMAAPCGGGLRAESLPR